MEKNFESSLSMLSSQYTQTFCLDSSSINYSVVINSTDNMNDVSFKGFFFKFLFHCNTQHILSLPQPPSLLFLSPLLHCFISLFALLL